ncbi:MAG: DUF2179 domain-containing protein [Maribacter sp.]
MFTFDFHPKPTVIYIYDAEGGYDINGKFNRSVVLFIVLTRLVIRKLNIGISKIDPKAFVVMNKIKDTLAGMIKIRVL